MPPKFLFVDDHTDQVPTDSFKIIPQDQMLRLSPEDVTPVEISDARVVLVDFVVDDWLLQEEREGANRDGIHPGNGLALIGTYRSLGESSDLNANRSPKAFALLTGDPGKLSSLSGSQREHAIARLRDLEWVFEKPATAQGWSDIERRLVALDDAFARFPSAWPTNPEAAADVIKSLLSLDMASSWSKTAWQSIVEAHAPLNELSNATHGNAFLRWLLQQALPYPGIFLDDVYLAGRLRTTASRLKAAFERDEQLRTRFEPALYTGILADFDGAHWWSAGVEIILFELTGGRPFDPSALAKIIEPSDNGNPREIVICLDAGFTPERENLYLVDDVVRVRPDDWPAFADQAYMSKDVIRANPQLRGIVHSDDLELVQ